MRNRCANLLTNLLTKVPTKLLTVLLAATVALPCFADELPAVTPYRPSVSSPANLPAPGQLELEFGGLAQRDHGARRASLPYALKLAFSEEWGVVMAGEAAVSVRDGAPGASRERGVGDTTLVLKRAWELEKGQALGLELSAKAPTAKDSIGSGKADYGVNGICSHDFGAIHLDANLNALRVGATGPGEGRWQTGLSASVSTPVNAQWGATAELAGTRRSGMSSTAQLLVAAAYSPHPRLTIDVGVARGLNRATTAWSWFSGVVFPIANFW